MITIQLMLANNRSLALTNPDAVPCNLGNDTAGMSPVVNKLLIKLILLVMDDTAFVLNATDGIATRVVCKFNNVALISSRSNPVLY